MSVVGQNHLSRKIYAVVSILLFLVPTISIIQPIDQVTQVNWELNANPNDSDESEPSSSEYYLTELDDAEWIPLIVSAEEGKMAESTVISSDASGIIVDSHIYGFWRQEDTHNGTAYDHIDLPGGSSQTANGSPEVPLLTEFIEIPHDIDVTVNITDFDVQWFEDYNIVPTQMPTVGLPEQSTRVFRKDETLYGTDAFYPNFNITSEGEKVSSPIIIRERRILRVDISPIQYNPSSGELRAFSWIRFHINYTQAADIEPVDASFHSEAFEAIYQDILLNYEEWSAPIPSLPMSIGQSEDHQITPSAFPTDRADYIIITDPSFYDAAKTLADWKTRKGVLTRIFTTDAIYSDTSEIFDHPTDSDDFPTLVDRLRDKIDEMKAFIREKYFELKPTYALFLGDVNHIPCDYNISHPATFHQGTMDLPIHGPIGISNISTDVTYFCIKGVDFYPEIIHGRISVETALEAQRVVDRILAYEIEPPDDPDFYSNVLMASYYQDWYDTSLAQIPDGREDEEFVQTALNISKYIHDLPYLVPYTVHVNFSTDPGVTPNYLYDGITQVPPNIDWSSDASDIINNLDEGRFLAYHVDHGTSKNFYWWYRSDWSNPVIGVFDGWAEPRFTVDNPSSIFNLDNQNKLPLILSMGCNTGWFDGETDGIVDQDYLNIHQNDCFAEEIIKMAGGGAIAAIASTRVSYNAPSADLAVGITNSFWPGIVKSIPYVLRPIRPTYNMGTAMYRGKTHVAKLFGGVTDSMQQNNVTQLVYNLFGDPETPLWTQNPQSMRVTYSTCINPGEHQSLSVKVTHSLGSVFNATVCLQKGSELYLVDRTDINGEVTFEIDSISIGWMNITITKDNYLPHIGLIQIAELCPVTILILAASALMLLLVVIIIKKKKTS